MGERIGFYQSCGNRGVLTYVCVWVAVVWVVKVGSGWGAWTRDWRGGVVLCMCEM